MSHCSIFDEVWDENDYVFRNQINLKTLPKNHLMKLENLKFNFIEYKTHQLVSCHIYERMTMHCRNQYGMFQDFFKPECIDALNYFQFCVELNTQYGLLKKYFPEQFVSHSHSRPIAHFKELNIGN